MCILFIYLYIYFPFWFKDRTKNEREIIMFFFWVFFDICILLVSNVVKYNIYKCVRQEALHSFSRLTSATA